MATPSAVRRSTVGAVAPAVAVRSRACAGSFRVRTSDPLGRVFSTDTPCGGARLAGRPWRACERVRGMSESPAATRESAGEGVAANRVRVSQNPVVHAAVATYVRNRLGRVWPTGVRVSRGRPAHAGTVGRVLWRVWLKGASGGRRDVFATRPLPYESESARVWPSWCLSVTESCFSHSHRHTRMGEGVAT